MTAETLIDRPAGKPGLSAARQAELERRLRGLLDEPAVEDGIGTGIARADRGGPLPLSWGQRRLWFLHRLNPDGAEYTVPTQLLLDGPLDVPVLRACLDELVRRHEILRTVYVPGGDGPCQLVRPASPIEFTVHADGAITASAEAERVTAEFVDRPFDLAADLMIRALLVRTGEGSHALTLAIHHIAIDGWSLGILQRELRALYAAGGDPAALGPQALQYADFASWQAASPDADGDLAYWTERLRGLEPLELPADRPRTAEPDHSGASVRLTIPADTAQAVLGLGRARGATAFMTLLAAFLVVLGRHTGRRDLAVGTPIHGRDRAETEDLVGFFVNTVVMRGDLSGDPTFGELVDRVRRAALEDYGHLSLPFERLVNELAVDRDASRSPLVQVMFAVDEDARVGTSVGELAIVEAPVRSSTAKFELTAGFEVLPDGSLGAVLEYASALFDEARMSRMAEHVGVLLAAVAERPDARLSQLDLLTAEERRRLLVERNATEAPYTPACLHELIAEQARRTPDAVAVRIGAAETSYARLEQRANQIAHRLRGLGVGLETPVGVLCERSENLLPALLGILKTGGHYVPLDPAYPAKRKQYMLEKSGARLLLTTSRHRAAAEELGLEALYLDEEAEALAALPAEPVHTPVDPDNLAYVIFTSGSTGLPKGVMISHAGVVHYLSWCRRAYRADEGDGAPVHSSLAFDLTVTGLFLPLMCGTTVTLVPEDEHPVAGLADALTSGRRYSFVKLTPAHLELLQRCLPPQAANAAAHLVVGGEQLTAEALAFWREHAPNVVVANEYGHTETSVANVIKLIPAGEAVRSPVSIGGPIWNTVVYLLDERLRPVPEGVPGEVYAGGIGVARGFVGSPGLTADRYMPDPFGPPGSRMYRSGDLARYRSDGTLEFVGRTDHQVKVRGYRIELGEIETCLTESPGVNESVVVLRDGALAGYLTPATADLGAVRAHLSERLPEYMVPGTLTPLDRLPLTANGKVDREALPAPRVADRAAAVLVRARDRLELAVTRIWEQALGRAPIGVTEDFFAAGGHSMLAVGVVDRLNAELGARLTLAELFRHRTVRQLCERIGAGASDSSTAVPLRALPADPAAPALFLAPPTAGSPFPYLPLVELLPPEWAVYGFEAPGHAAGEQPAGSIEELAALFLADARRVRPDGPLHLAGWSFGGAVAFEMAAQLERRGERPGSLTLIDSSVLGVDAVSALPEAEAGDAMAVFGRGYLDLEQDALDGLSPEEAMAELLSQARTRELVPAAAGGEAIERMAAVYLAHSRATSRHRTDAVLGTDIHLVRSLRRHPTLGGPQVRAESWAGRTGGRVLETRIDADHWSIVEPPHVADLAAALAAALGRD